MLTIMDTIQKVGFVPVVALKNEKKAVPLAQALEKGGIPIIEVTYRTAQASDCIRRIRENCPDVIVGAGTVLTIEQVQEAVECGAMFIVAPGFDSRVVSYCLEHSIPIIPGVSNPSEIQQAVGMGLKVLKLFPAEPVGGLSAVNFMAAPFPGIKFLPAGGVLMSNLGEYLSNEHVFACAGGFVARANMIEAGDWDGITEVCEQAIDAALGFEFAHVGLNCGTQEAAHSCASFFMKNFNQTEKEGNSSIFIDKRMELMKKPFYGTNGHIGFYTNSVERAVYHLERRGCKIADDTIRKNDKGTMQSVYLQGEVNGFAVHVVRK